ncbi:hypothetical protein J40TS1_20860 [Paenibacillus montaniterrae]|uniref:Uncharacterized protein n=1 Tax=Paenibacillus montaniterrae TaxID=429341 RepID=A0A919YQM1_9BACL|nr:hypothetical protein [Paenibacillus montaniterrae]GIP16444.1 hypothetical protein J40TS1_20860 [Paenibacillus montaniterrae]
MNRFVPTHFKVLIASLAVALAASLIANLYWFSSSRNDKLENFSHQQYNQVLSDYENAILSTSQLILSILDDAINNKNIDKEELLILYKSYEALKEDQIQYAYYVQAYSSPEGKNATKRELNNESITLNYVPGFIYFNSSLALFKELLLQSGSHTDIVVTPELEQKLQLVNEIVRLNTSIYEKYINEDFTPSSNEAILTRLKLQKELTTSFTKLVELDVELSRLDK